jgi:hypothetical protein
MRTAFSSTNVSLLVSTYGLHLISGEHPRATMLAPRRSSGEPATLDNEADGLMLPHTGALTACGALLLIFILLLAYCVWTLNRGFDITDESYSLLLSIYPQTFKIFVSAAYWITSLLWQATGSLIAFRASGLVLLLIGAAVLALGAIRAAEQCDMSLLPGHTARLAVVVNACLFALHWDCYGGSIFFTPFYNLITITGTYCAIGFILLSTGRTKAVACGLHALAGGCLGFVMLSKFPTGIDMLGLSFLFILLSENTWKIRLTGIALIISMALLTIIMMAWRQMGVFEAWQYFHLGLHFYGVALDDSADARLLRYATEMVAHISSILSHFWLPLAFFALSCAIRRATFTFVGIGIITLQIVTGGYLRGGIDKLDSQILIADALFISFLLMTVSRWAQGRAILFVLMLAAIPYGIAVGTNNVLPPQILISLAPWGALCTIISFSHRLSPWIRVPSLLMCVVYAAGLALPIISSAWQSAYHSKEPLIRQTEAVAIHRLGEILVDHEVHTFIDSLQEAAKKCGIEQGRDFIGLYNIPGVALVLGAVPILTPWLVDQHQAQAWLETAPDTNNAIIAIQYLPDGNRPDIPKAVIGFPERYRNCGAVIFPYHEQKIELWAP